MTDDPTAARRNLYERTKALLEPGERELIGCLVHTDLGSDEELEMQELAVEINDVIADHADAGETFIYAGNDDPEFASNQYHGLTVADEEFVWESQHLLRDGTFDLVYYYDAGADQDAIVRDIAALGPEVTPVPSPTFES